MLRVQHTPTVPSFTYEACTHSDTDKLTDARTNA
eukprot:CAMPEP_0119300126 /NCGR_PEP_ID=MMETSP1333-20130426/2129_1 /TAXON_ID=418940 /ORGANISM="Scyphosphaera apsteinii, Strain RCC1455" /LENGTH=33 /DNA_ID= /DNA_START= /DNA_END= /DNA_ORIENTATION=